MYIIYIYWSPFLHDSNLIVVNQKRCPLAFTISKFPRNSPKPSYLNPKVLNAWFDAHRPSRSETSWERKSSGRRLLQEEGGGRLQSIPQCLRPKPNNSQLVFLLWLQGQVYKPFLDLGVCLKDGGACWFSLLGPCL